MCDNQADEVATAQLWRGIHNSSSNRDCPLPLYTMFASKGTSTGITMFLLRSHTFLHQIELNRDREVRSNIVDGAFHAALAILT